MPPSRPELTGSLGAVSSTHWLASAAGMAVLDEGGNAFDAAVAAGMVLQVVEPHSNGLGGDACVVGYDAASGRCWVICGQGPMPRGATIEHFESLGLTQIPGSGLLPATVPGAFGAWLRLLGEYGTRSLRCVLSAAIGYAEDGFPLASDSARAIEALVPLFRTEWAESGRTYLTADGTAPPAGSRVRNPALASTMRRLLAEAEAAPGGRDRQLEAAHRAFYEGFVAEAVDAFAREPALDSTGRWNAGLLTGDDLAAWKVPVEPAAELSYRGCTVHKPGSWSQGPVFLQQLALLADTDLAEMELAGGEYVHTLTEAAKLAFADREAWYGDAPGTADTLTDLLDPAYTAGRQALLGPQSAIDPGPGSPRRRASFAPVAPPNPAPADPADWMAQLQSGMPTVVDAAVLRATVKNGDTCTVVAADRHGNLVAAVPSGGWLKSSPVIPGLGFPLGTRGQSMWLTRNHPNSLAPGRRPRTTLSPSVVLRDGRPWLAFGTPGGDRQDQWTLEAFLAVAEFGLDLQAATETAAFHTDHFPASFTPRKRRENTLVLEARPDAPSVTELRARGHRVEVVPELSLGAKVCFVAAPDSEGLVAAAAGPRGRQAYAACR